MCYCCSEVRNFGVQKVQNAKKIKGTTFGTVCGFVSGGMRDFLEKGASPAVRSCPGCILESLDFPIVSGITTNPSVSVVMPKIPIPD